MCRVDRTDATNCDREREKKMNLFFLPSLLTSGGLTFPPPQTLEWGKTVDGYR